MLDTAQEVHIFKYLIQLLHESSEDTYEYVCTPWCMCMRVCLSTYESERRSSEIFQKKIQ